MSDHYSDLGPKIRKVSSLLRSEDASDHTTYYSGSVDIERLQTGLKTKEYNS